MKRKEMKTEEDGEEEGDDDDEEEEEDDDDERSGASRHRTTLLIHTGLFHFGQLQGVEAGMREAFEAMTNTGKGIQVQRSKEIMEQRRMLPIMNVRRV